MSDPSPILSVMVISHNQVNLIGRCLESILRQRIRVPWEIVISDDASMDGTWEWIQELAKLRTEEIGLRINEIRGEILDGELVPEITCSQINSSDYNPTVTSDRCAANKANVYSHARGKYCVNIDADDYLLGDDIYQYQIDQLEAHPECTMALQNIWYQNDGEPVENGHSWHSANAYREDEILSLKSYCLRRLFISNPAFMMRRDPELKPMEKYGLLFDDNIISMHHIIMGNIICTKKTQYVYVQYKHSIWNQVLTAYHDANFRMMMPMLVYLKFYPKQSEFLINAEIYNWLSATKKILENNSVLLSDATKRYLNYCDNRYINCLKENKHYFYLIFGLKFSLLISKYEIRNSLIIWLFKKYMGIPT